MAATISACRPCSLQLHPRQRCRHLQHSGVRCSESVRLSLKPRWLQTGYGESAHRTETSKHRCVCACELEKEKEKDGYRFTRRSLPQTRRI